SFKPCLRGAVDAGSALRRHDKDRVIDGVKLSQIWKPPLIELHGGDGTDGRDEFAAGNAGRASFQDGDGVRDGEDVLQRSIPARTIADQNNVVVRVDDAGDYGLSLEIDGSDALRRNRVANRGDAAVAD